VERRIIPIDPNFLMVIYHVLSALAIKWVVNLQSVEIKPVSTQLFLLSIFELVEEVLLHVFQARKRVR
jgi:hypothetical protein